MLPYGNSHAYTIVKCGEFRLCHDTGSACYDRRLGYRMITITHQIKRK